MISEENPEDCQVRGFSPGVLADSRYMMRPARVLL